MKKLLTITSILMAAQCGVKAQTFCPPAVVYQYDAAGNRINRQPGQCRLAPDQDQNQEDNYCPNFANDPGFAIQLFPNPTQGLMQVQATASFMDLENKSVSIYSIKGELLHQQNITTQTFNLDFTAYAPGYYIVHATATNYSKRWKVQRE